MSSGSVLLQQLRSRQSSQSSSSIQKTNNSDDKNDNTDIKSSSRYGNAAAPNNPSVAEISQPLISAIGPTKKDKVIEVCLGPDCAVAGGGAALLEIEDLVRQQLCPNKESNNKDAEVIVQSGGCRDQCTEGPNVRILSSNGGGSGVDFDFHKVNSPEACRRVVRSLFPREDTPANNEFLAGQSTLAMGAGSINESNDSADFSSDGVVARLLLRKEDARRWKAHRERAAKERRLQAISRNQGDKNERSRC